MVPATVTGLYNRSSKKQHEEAGGKQDEKDEFPKKLSIKSMMDFFPDNDSRHQKGEHPRGSLYDRRGKDSGPQVVYNKYGIQGRPEETEGGSEIALVREGF